MDLKPLFRVMAEKQASDLFFSAGAPVFIKMEGRLRRVNKQVLDAALLKQIAYSLMSPEQIREFETAREMNFAYGVPEVGRFRVNVFWQRSSVAMVIRYISGLVPDPDTLGLPVAVKDFVMEKRGLVLVVGATGSGKSTTLASMIDYRNANQPGHILAVEDPIEFVHRHKKSIVNQREIGMDTLSYGNALVNAMREAPDVLVIGEIRDAEVMRQAILYTQSGHLCLATLHANNAYHALTRIISFFPLEAREHLLADLAASLRAVVSQRLVPGVDGKRVAAVEVMLNSLYVADLIRRQDIGGIKDAMEQSINDASQTFERALFDLYQAGRISLDEALANADSRNNLEWLIKNYAADKPPESVLARPNGTKPAEGDFSDITIMPELLG
ncbi:MAG: PilT/PilU family type 4a pilus ATPase [Betaproteobacteria bacterium]|nr:PilT/PilU family type 4a pilus ATPase [Betaproteobacteria bacterium]